jgi:D-3-phosphoglycerate dehydrogenase
LVIHNRDVPGVIGFIGQTLAGGTVNIANMNLSRRTTHGKVASLITLDSPIPKAVLDQLRAHEDIFDVTPVYLP